MDYTDNPVELGAEVVRLQDNLQMECQSSRALGVAIEFHCRGQYVPEEVARFCRTHAVNLDRDLARAKGDPPPRLADYMRDFSEKDLTDAPPGATVGHDENEKRGG